jgi:hypothetical protein
MPSKIRSTAARTPAVSWALADVAHGMQRAHEVSARILPAIFIDPLVFIFPPVFIFPGEVAVLDSLSGARASARRPRRVGSPRARVATRESGVK